jgi:hypothetical protein
MDEQKVMSERISETATFSNEIYEAITEMLNLVKLNGVSSGGFFVFNNSIFLSSLL